MKRGQILSRVVIAAALLLGSLVATSSRVSSQECRYFSETGHYVCGQFLDFFNTRGGLEIFGYPLTEAFNDPTHGGLRVQYFQKSRMEWHPYNSDPYKVQLGLLVDELGYDYPPARSHQIPSSNSALHHYFPETKHVVSYAFLDYFNRKGGLDIFGYPRSEFMYESGHLVQYFQRARMEWHPERASGSQMSLANLGEIYIEQVGVPKEYLDPVDPMRLGEESGPTPIGSPSTAEAAVTQLNISASVRYAITGRQGGQTIFVYVNDQQQQPVQGANAEAIIHYPSGDQRCDLSTTDASGFTKCSFDITESPPGKRVVIDVTVTYNDLTATTQTFFLPWW